MGRKTDDFFKAVGIDYSFEDLVHYRTPGSKNGVRLYQNADGTYTPLGMVHYGIGLRKKEHYADPNYKPAWYDFYDKYKRNELNNYIKNNGGQKYYKGYERAEFQNGNAYRGTKVARENIKNDKQHKKELKKAKDDFFESLITNLTTKSIEKTKEIPGKAKEIIKKFPGKVKRYASDKVSSYLGLNKKAEAINRTIIEPNLAISSSDFIKSNSSKEKGRKAVKTAKIIFALMGRPIELINEDSFDSFFDSYDEFQDSKRRNKRYNQ